MSDAKFKFVVESHVKTKVNVQRLIYFLKNCAWFFNNESKLDFSVSKFTDNKTDLILLGVCFIFLVEFSSIVVVLASIIFFKQL